MPVARARLLLVVSAVYVLGGGFVHLTEWADGYRRIPAAVPGSWLVRDGFPANAAVSVVAAAALLYMAVRPGRGLLPVLAANIGFQLSSLALLIATRMTTVFGWSEPSWTPGANRARAVEIGALLMLGLTIVARQRMNQESDSRNLGGWPTLQSLAPDTSG